MHRDEGGAHNNLAAALLAVGRVEEAVADFQEALRRRPDHPQGRRGCTRLWRSQTPGGEDLAGLLPRRRVDAVRRDLVAWDIDLFESARDANGA